MPDPSAHVRYAYDLRGLQTVAWFPWTGEAISNKFDGFGRLTEATSTMGGFSRKIGHAFDRDGRRVELSWSDLARAWFTRDELGRIKMGYQGALADASTPMVAFAYNSGGLLYYFTRKGGDCTQYGYDVALRLSSLYHCFGGGTGNVLQRIFPRWKSTLLSVARAAEDKDRRSRVIIVDPLLDQRYSVTGSARTSCFHQIEPMRMRNGVDMKVRTYLVYGFEGRGGKYLVVETASASEARDLHDARMASGFRTLVSSSDGELAPGELDQLADLELRFR
ncbi:MAG: hypothetical protein ACJ8ER_09920 [Allosphingosinicella sp.]